MAGNRESKSQKRLMTLRHRNIRIWSITTIVRAVTIPSKAIDPTHVSPECCV